MGESGGFGSDPGMWGTAPYLNFSQFLEILWEIES